MTYITTTTCRSSAAAANTRVTQARHFEQQPIKFLHLALVFRFIMTRAEQVSAKQDKVNKIDVCKEIIRLEGAALRKEPHAGARKRTRAAIEAARGLGAVQDSAIDLSSDSESD